MIKGTSNLYTEKKQKQKQIKRYLRGNGDSSVIIDTIACFLTFYILEKGFIHCLFFLIAVKLKE